MKLRTMFDMFGSLETQSNFGVENPIFKGTNFISRIMDSNTNNVRHIVLEFNMAKTTWN